MSKLYTSIPKSRQTYIHSSFLDSCDCLLLTAEKGAVLCLGLVVSGSLKILPAPPRLHHQWSGCRPATEVSYYGAASCFLFFCQSEASSKGYPWLWKVLSLCASLSSPWPGTLWWDSSYNLPLYAELHSTTFDVGHPELALSTWHPSQQRTQYVIVDVLYRDFTNKDTRGTFTNLRFSFKVSAKKSEGEAAHKLTWPPQNQAYIQSSIQPHAEANQVSKPQVSCLWLQGLHFEAALRLPVATSGWALVFPLCCQLF